MGSWVQVGGLDDGRASPGPGRVGSAASILVVVVAAAAAMEGLLFRGDGLGFGGVGGDLIRLAEMSRRGRKVGVKSPRSSASRSSGESDMSPRSSVAVGGDGDGGGCSEGGGVAGRGNRGTAGDESS